MRSLERMGTAAVNRIYEADPRYKYDKPRGSQIERKERDAYIRKKYADRVFRALQHFSSPASHGASQERCGQYARARSLVHCARR